MDTENGYFLHVEISKVVAIWPQIYCFRVVNIASLKGARSPSISATSLVGVAFGGLS